MGFAYNFWGILKPTVVGASFLASLSVAFVVACILIDYQTYLKVYQVSHAQEVEALKEKVDATLGSIKNLLQLTEARIQAAYRVEENPQELIQRIEWILASLHHLPLHTLSEPQHVSYNKLSPPYMTISRFGALPLDAGKVTLENVLRDNREPLLIFGDKAIKGRLPVLNLQNSLEGMLEIQFDLEAFKRFLGPYRTVHFDQLSSQNAVAILKAPFPAYAKPPDPFWAYVRIHQSHYAAFALYALFTLVFIGLYLSFLNRRLHKSYRHQFENLEDALSKTGTAEKTLRAELGMCQQDTLTTHQF